ncbi:MAG: hypothetical protein HVN35_10980 [Methanobacteriaceae archaeon]|nr:hypothetical protein [Methanobacteriaceae archaeon]
MEENIVSKVELSETKPSRTIEMALGIAGGIFGLIGGIIGLIFVPELGVSAILASIVGIIAAIYVTRNPKWGGIILIISAIWLLISISLFGVLGCILIFIAGLVALVRK